MTMTDTPPTTDSAASAGRADSPPVRATEPTAFERLVGSGDHRTIGRAFVVCSLLFLAAGAVLSALLDVDTASDSSIFSGETAKRLLMNNQVGLLLLGVLPLLLGVAISVVPRQVGSPAIAFPRAAAAALWSWLGSSVVFIVTVAADGAYGGGHLKAARLGNVAVGALLVALCLAAICVAVTVLSLRPAGLGINRVPFFSFSMLVMSTIIVLTLPASLAHVIVGHVAQADGAGLVTASFASGLSWLLEPPTVFVLLIPLLGLLADVAATAVGGRQRSRGAVQVLIGLAGATSYGAWAQGSAAQSTLVWAGLVALAGLPLLGVLAAVGDTLRQGKPKLMSPLAFGTLSILIALVGVGIGLLRVINSIGKGDLADFDLVSVASSQSRLVLGAAVIAALGGIFYWGRQIFGAVLPEQAGIGVAMLAGLGVTLWGVPWLIAGLANADVTVYAAIATAGGIAIALASLLVCGAGLRAASGASSPQGSDADVWGGGATLEWRDDAASLPDIDSAYPLLDGKDAS